MNEARELVAQRSILGDAICAVLENHGNSGVDPWELEAALRDFVAYYNNLRYHESFDNVTPADLYFGRQFEVLTERAKIKKKTMQRRKKEYFAAKAAETENCLFARAVRCPDHFADVQCITVPSQGHQRSNR